MSWIKPNFLWMMYRCGWAAKENQKSVLAISINKTDFDIQPVYQDSLNLSQFQQNSINFQILGNEFPV